MGAATPLGLNLIGPNKQPSLGQNNPGPSGSGGPVARGRALPHAPADGPPEYACEFPGCERTFDTKTGRGLHHRRGHPDWTDERQNLVAVKARWNDEETRLLARREVELVRAGVRFINQSLVEAFPERTLEAIKGKRKQPVYRRIVAELLEQPADDEAEVRVELEHPPDNDYRTEIENYVIGMPVPERADFNIQYLVEICEALPSSTPDEILEKLTLYLRDTFPFKQRKTRRSRAPNEEGISRRQQRKSEYARTQDLWRKNRGKCIRMLLDDISDVRVPPKANMVPFWRQIMTTNDCTSPGFEQVRPTIVGLWTPILDHEIKNAMPSTPTSAGPDGMSARFVKKIPLEVLARIFNVMMWCGKAPTRLLESITTLIPKKPGASTPADFRPITVSSVLTRIMHKVLATRMARQVKLDARQRAFRPTDGCSDNIFLLDIALRYHHKKHKPLYLASLDIAKAFDSVTHQTIEETLKIMGVPAPMTAYIMDVYARSSTSLTCNSWTSDKIYPTCGVKQGDPMSPMIFNMIIDRLLTRLPEEIGARIGDLCVNAAAFADDMLLFATTPLGLQKLLDTSVQYLSGCGLKVNAAKCMTVALRNVPHEKKTVVDRDTVFMCGNRVLPSLRRTDDWKYLGVPFTPEGRAKVKVTQKLSDSIDKLTKAPLKPQQRMFALRTLVIPSLYHQLELGSTNISILRKCDAMLREAVRRWLSLPHDTPNAYIHSNARNGGLGIASLRWTVPLRRLQRLHRLPLAEEPATGTPGSFLRNETTHCQLRLRDVEGTLESNADIDARWARMLYAKVDGVGLKESEKVPQQHAWVLDGTRFLSGKDYLNACKLRINAMPTRSGTSRGRPQNRLCRAGCMRAETLNHVLQQCHRTHGPRIKRHDALVSYVTRALESSSFRTCVEPKIETAMGLRKPDIIAIKGNRGLVIDAQVINDQWCLDRAHKSKIDYYREVEVDILNKYQVEQIEYSTITLNWRGVWGEESAKSLLDLRVIRKKDLRVLSTRAIVGSLCGFYQFNKTTMVHRTAA